MRWPWLGCLVMFVLVLPSVAANAEGTLNVQSRVIVGPGATTSADVLGAYWEDVSGMRELMVVAPRLHVEVLEFESLDATVLRPSYADRSRAFDLTDARVVLTAPPDGGWVGYYGGRPDEPAGLSGSELEIELVEGSIGNAVSAEEGAIDSGRPVFAVSPRGAYARVRGDFLLTASGDLALKLMGPTVRMESAENTTTLWTGSRSSGVPGQVTSRWLALSASEGSLRVDVPHPGLAATRRASVDVDGVARFEDATGTVTSADGSYVVMSTDATFSGQLHMGVLPDPATDSLLVDFSGSVASASVPLANAPPGAPVPSRLWLVPIGALGLAAVGAVVIHAHRHKHVGLTPEECTDVAYAAADEGRMHDALAWIVRARAAAPTSVRLMLDEAVYRARLGELPAALVILRAASDAAPDGEPDYLAAVLLAEAGADAAEIVPRLVAALRRTPALVLEVEEDAAFIPSCSDPGLLSAIREAHRRLHDASLN